MSLVHLDTGVLALLSCQLTLAVMTLFAVVVLVVASLLCAGANLHNLVPRRGRCTRAILKHGTTNERSKW